MAGRTPAAGSKPSRIRSGSASTHSSSMRRTHACCAAARPSRSRRRPSMCCARSRANAERCSPRTRCWTRCGATSSSATRCCDRHQRAAHGARRRCPPAALHRNRVAPRLPLHRRASESPRRRSRPLPLSRRATSPSFIGRAEALPAFAARGTGLQRAARGGLGGGGTGHRQDHADRALRRRSRRVACARGQCVEHYGTGEPYLPVLEALAELCRGDSTLRTAAAHGGADLAAATAMAQDRGRARRAAA